MITTKRKQVKCSNKECSANAKLKNQNEK
jgi:hypothetical protein